MFWVESRDASSRDERYQAGPTPLGGFHGTLTDRVETTAGSSLAGVSCCVDWLLREPTQSEPNSCQTLRTLRAFAAIEDSIARAIA